MNIFKLATLFSITYLFNSSLGAQRADTGNQLLALHKIIYHSSHCNGSCPAIDLELDSNNTVLLKRDVWTKKGEKDQNRSGNFKGKIDPHTFFDLKSILTLTNYTTLKFPPIYCCDGSITTIIIYADGKRSKLSSMIPPPEAHRLIKFLYDLALKLNIPSTAEDIKLEQ